MFLSCLFKISTNSFPLSHESHQGHEAHESHEAPMKAMGLEELKNMNVKERIVAT